jgi:hypothetical protein
MKEGGGDGGGADIVDFLSRAVDGVNVGTLHQQHRHHCLRTPVYRQIRWRASYGQHGVGGFVGEGGRERQRETTGYEPFALSFQRGW